MEAAVGRVCPQRAGAATKGGSPDQPQRREERREDTNRNLYAPRFRAPIARSVWSAAYPAAFGCPTRKPRAFQASRKGQSGGIRRTPNASRHHIVPRKPALAAQELGGGRQMHPCNCCYAKAR